MAGRQYVIEYDTPNGWRAPQGITYSEAAKDSTVAKLKARRIPYRVLEVKVLELV